MESSSLSTYARGKRIVPGGDKMKKNKAIILISIILFINMVAICLLGVKVYQLNGQMKIDETTKYVMYVGLNDKDTYEQIVPTDEAKNIIDRICIKYVDGYTIQDAKGVWADEIGKSTYENTVVCYFSDTDSETVYKIADEIIKKLNQNAVLIEKNQVVTDFYSSIGK